MEEKPKTEETHLVLEKPVFTEEIIANISKIPEVTSNISHVKEYATKLQDFYKSIVFTEETMKDAKDEKANINKFKTTVSDYRKNILSEFKKPIEEFETLAKDTEKILSETYTTINEQVSNYENGIKKEKKKKIINYFNEYKASLEIDFVEFEQANIKVNLNSTEKSLKEAAQSFLDKIKEDLDLIETQEYKEEILVEYKSTLNVTTSIKTVVNRKEAIKKEKERLEKEAEIKRQEEAIKQETLQTNTNIPTIEKPVEEVIVKKVQQEEILTVTVTVTGTREQLRQFRDYIKNIGLERIKE